MAKSTYYKNGVYDPGSDPRPFSALTDPNEIAIRGGGTAPTTKPAPSVPSGVSYNPATNISTAGTPSTKPTFSMQPKPIPSEMDYDPKNPQITQANDGSFHYQYGPGATINVSQEEIAFIKANPNLSPLDALRKMQGTLNKSPSSTPTAPNLTKVPTGSTGPGGETIYDVFAGGEHIADPNDPRLKGVNIAGLPEGQTPGGFQSKFLPVDTDMGEGAISDTTKQQAAVAKTQEDIKKGLTDIGMAPPEDKTDALVTKQLDDLKKRQEEMDKRREADIARLEKSYATAGEELDISQKEALAKAEGRTRIGGFITKMETDDLQALQRKFRLETVSLEGQKSEAILAAQRAYDDQDFKLAQTQLEVAQKAGQDLYNRKQDYFDNIIKMQNYYEKLNKPIKDAEQADVDMALSMFEAAPSAFEDIKPSDIALGKTSYGEILTRYLDSPEYALEIRGQKADVLRKEQLARGGEEIPEEADVITLYGDAIQSAIDQGASPEEVVSVISKIASKEAVTLNLDSRAKIKKYAQSLTPKEAPAPEVIPKETPGGGIFGAVKSFFSRLFTR